MKKPTPLDEALAFFDAASAKAVAKPPEDGFYSAKQWAEMKGLKMQQGMKIHLDQMVRGGLAEVRQFRIGRHLTSCYRIFPT